MNQPCPVTVAENREIDGFDLISVLGLMKEYNRQEIWRRYRPLEGRTESISMYVAAEHYFLEMHLQKMQRVILSEKFNTNPFFMQQVVQRIIASHAHSLIMDKIRQQGIDTGDNPIALSCSMGDTMIDLIVNQNQPFYQKTPTGYGNSPIEQVEKRPLDVYDLSSILYLCQQNLSDAIFRRYENPKDEKTAGSARPEVTMSTRVGDYSVQLAFHRIATDEGVFVPPPGNVAAFTMHQVIQRMNFRHSDALILREMQAFGLSVALEQVRTEFTLRRYLNDTALSLTFIRQS